jgi:hypothetical protein
VYLGQDLNDLAVFDLFLKDKTGQQTDSNPICNQLFACSEIFANHHRFAQLV